MEEACDELSTCIAAERCMLMPAIACKGMVSISIQINTVRNFNMAEMKPLKT